MKKIVGDGIIFNLIQFDVDVGGGKLKTFEKAIRAPGVRVIIEDGAGRILLSEEFRHELDALDFRLPGGKVFDTKKEFFDFQGTGSDIEDAVVRAAVREASEEVGVSISAENVELFSRSVCGATVEWDLYYVVVRVFDEDGNQSLQELEVDDIVGKDRYNKEDILNMLYSGKIKEGRTVAALLQYFLG